MAGSRMDFWGCLRRNFGALLVAVSAGLAVSLAAGPTRAIPIFDPADMPPEFQTASLPIAFADVPSNTPLSLNSSENQQLEPTLGIRFGGGAFQSAGGLPFPGAHVGASGNRLTITFSMETIAIGVDVLSAAEDAEPDGLTFEATFEDGSTEQFQFPLELTPEAIFGAPFSEEPAFAGFRTGANNLITQLDIFQSIVGDPDRLEQIPAQDSFPRIGNALLATIIPEPGTAVLLGIGLAALAGLRRAKGGGPRRGGGPD